MTSRTTAGSARRLVSAGVIGVGSMGRHHARVYSEQPGVELVGVADADADRAAEIAAERHTCALDIDALTEAADLVSIAVPTVHHYELARECIERGCHVLVEKPFTAEVTQARSLVSLARNADVVVQVGHIERFNPAFETVKEVLAEQELIAIDAQRLGPPLARAVGDSAVTDLMIHDIDILLALVKGDPTLVSAVGIHENRHASAQLRFENGVMASLTASRLTQQKVRRLGVTAHECRVNADYTNQSVEIHRVSLPEYVETNGGVRYRNESVVERPTVQNGEPLKAELSAFVSTVRSDSEPVVSAEDGLRALELAHRIDDLASRRETVATKPERHAG